MTKYACANCDFTADEDSFKPAKHLSQRIDPGGIYTDIECPKCGALAYPVPQTQPKTKEVAVCTHCGSDDVVADAAARWDIDTQEWDITNVFDKGHSCGNCGGECSIEFKPITDFETCSSCGEPVTDWENHEC